MGVLLFTCPKTGQDFSTGVFVDKDDADRLPNVLSRSRCPYCGRVHHWWRHNARYVEAFPLADDLGQERRQERTKEGG
jgi:hypothetical protein